MIKRTYELVPGYTVEIEGTPEEHLVQLIYWAGILITVEFLFAAYFIEFWKRFEGEAA